MPSLSNNLAKTKKFFYYLTPEKLFPLEYSLRARPVARRPRDRTQPETGLSMQ